MGTNFQRFAAQIDDFAQEQLPERLRTAQIKIGLEALRGVVLKTPVDTGRARANWQTTIGQPAQGKLNREDPSRDGNVAITEGAATIQGVRPFGTIWLTNNVDYAEVLENGRSDQAPNGMVATTLTEIATQFRRIE